MNKSSNQGFTLIELAIGQVVIGLIVVIAWHFGVRAYQSVQQIEAPQTLMAADQALTGFITANHRLPCPDTQNSGYEDCSSSNATGKLPVATLGLARADMTNIRYGVFRSAINNADLAVAKDRFYPLLAAIPATDGVAPIAFNTPLGNINGIDFCQALSLGAGLQNGTPISSALNIKGTDNGIIKNVAYAISLPGIGSNPGSDLNDASFAAPSRVVSSTYHDTVLAVDFSQVFDRMSCTSILAATSHAHPNAASAAAVMNGAMFDSKVQLDLAAELANFNLLSATAGNVAAVAHALTSATNVATAMAYTILTFGAAAPMDVAAVAAVVVNAAAIISSAISTASAVVSKQTCTDRVNEFSGNASSSLHLLENSSTLAATIRANAIAADAAGIY